MYVCKIHIIFLNSVHAEQHHEHGPDYVYEPSTGTRGGYANWLMKHMTSSSNHPSQVIASLYTSSLDYVTSLQKSQTIIIKKSSSTIHSQKHPPASCHYSPQHPTQFSTPAPPHASPQSHPCTYKPGTHTAWTHITPTIYYTTSTTIACNQISSKPPPKSTNTSQK